MRYRSGLLVQTTGTLRDDFDIERMDAISETHRVHFLNLARQARLLAPDCLPLSAGPCLVCRKCTYPHRPPAASRESNFLHGGLWPAGQ